MIHTYRSHTGYTKQEYGLTAIISVNVTHACNLPFNVPFCLVTVDVQESVVLEVGHCILKAPVRVFFIFLNIDSKYNQLDGNCYHLEPFL